MGVGLLFSSLDLPGPRIELHLRLPVFTTARPGKPIYIINALQTKVNRLFGNLQNDLKFHVKDLKSEI